VAAQQQGSPPASLAGHDSRHHHPRMVVVREAEAAAIRTAMEVIGKALQHYHAGRLDEAELLSRQVLAVDPCQVNGLHLLGLVLQEQGRLDEAIACTRQGLDLKPDSPVEAYHNLGELLKKQRRLDEAIACIRKGLDLKPDDPDAHLGLAAALLARGDMAEGWEEYEWRWKTAKMIKNVRNFSQPQWRGEVAEGRTLLIHAEQGLGDTIQFCRYASRAAARGLRVIMEVQRPLVRLFHSLPWVDLVLGYGEELPDFDLHCPMLSLPLALRTTITTIPSGTCYLHADEAQATAWRARLVSMANQGPRIGLVWAGNPDATTIDRLRSLAPDRLAPLFDLPGLHFFSLQKGGPAAPENFPLTNFMDEMEDLADTAALIANLDLVISVDTAVAHLAGALGKPVWLLDRFDPCWRWLTGRRDSPWYPSLRLYRQPSRGDWDTVLAEVTRDLCSLALEAG
jgi:Tetratricopeptide repeat/Glycosyltransferase family 9 (heptosyltransferase)